MRLCSALLAVVCAMPLCAQIPADPTIDQARARIEKMRELVDAGALPRVQLERAEENLADAQDAAYLRKTLYGQDLTEEQAEQMISACERRLDRRKKAYTRGQELVQQGVATMLSLGTYLEEIDRARKEYDLAVSRTRLLKELAAQARAEEELQQKLANAPAEATSLADRFDGNGVFSFAAFHQIELAFLARFDRSLPVSAVGETAVHRSLGFDHRNRVDVAVHPDQPEGVWLRQYLTQAGIPYFAFRHAVPGKATGAHIHIGPMSTRIAAGG